jgi:hypothetical protein
MNQQLNQQMHFISYACPITLYVSADDGSIAAETYVGLLDMLKK